MVPVVDRVVVADLVVVTVFVVEVEVAVVVVVVSEAAVAVCALEVVVGVVCDVAVVVVVGVVCGADSAAVVWLSVGAVVDDEVAVGAVGRLTLAVLLVICVSVFEMLLAMLDAPPDPHPATTTAKRPATAALRLIIVGSCRK
jgi:hypothetical protein